VLAFELATGLGLECRGVSFPGHMVKSSLPSQVVDPFNGQSLSREELAERLELPSAH
jgi:regulator of sirC expression with transglutaminase-like and TPR domain